MGALIARIKARLGRWFMALRARYRWLDHAVRAWLRYKQNSGDYLAGAITYFSFLSLFPLILLGVAIAAFALKSHPAALQSLLDNVERNVPGGLGDTIEQAINTAIKARTSVGIVGLVGTLLAGLGWVANLRLATRLVWGSGKLKRPFLSAKLADLAILAALGAGLLASLALTAGGTRLSTVLLDKVGLGTGATARTIAAVVGIVLALLADMVIFGFLLVRLPRARVPWWTAVRGAALAAVGYELLKLLGTYYIARVTSSPAASAVGSVLGVLVFFNLVFRYLLFCVAWIATGIDRWDYVVATEDLDEPDIVAPPSATSSRPGPDATAASPSVGVVAGALLGTGAVIGAAVATVLRASRRRRGSADRGAAKQNTAAK